MLVSRDLRAGLVIDAVLVALCIEHGQADVSADSDSARFGGARSAPSTPVQLVPDRAGAGSADALD